MTLFVDLVALSNGLHGSVQMDSVALFSWIVWLRHHGILKFEEKDIPSIFSTLAWDEIENNLEYGSLEYVIAEIQYTSKELLGKEELSKAELNIIKELYDLYGGRMMIVASREASTYEKYSLYYIRELMKTWIMKGYSVEDVENGKR